MMLYCGDHDVGFDTDEDNETHRFCHDTSGRRLMDDSASMNEYKMLEAENERLRRALTQIIIHCTYLAAGGVAGHAQTIALCDRALKGLD